MTSIPVINGLCRSQYSVAWASIPLICGQLYSPSMNYYPTSGFKKANLNMTQVEHLPFFALRASGTLYSPNADWLRLARFLLSHVHVLLLALISYTTLMLLLFQPIRKYCNCHDIFPPRFLDAATRTSIPTVPISPVLANTIFTTHVTRIDCAHTQFLHQICTALQPMHVRHCLADQAHKSSSKGHTDSLAVIILNQSRSLAFQRAC
ncbi:uncharacterized protein EI90DRAFT_555502 [Cantharellus anzutake]|uniref:uncharacterized protein n=1 Tax=Cantharellus anzutake TaxID=1750568 RepID=UPI001904D520|nr:uncharacterized protein EI90DRAFT_555502 [Cantharellus anzutake]KAF8313355.1 hypothetical protein EI90DRAFT_555502 [Cantharellus anzutake]